MIIFFITGYGHATPRTIGGKLFCIGYALVGIPLNIVMFQSIGERFNIGITAVMKRMKGLCRSRNGEKVEVTQCELTLVASILCSAVLFGGAGAFYYFEGWEWPDAFYYCFITMSTIGFGDFVALQNPTMMALIKRPEYVAFSILYILFGLTVFAAALNLLVLRMLTMNTEDERKDELQALEAKRKEVKVEGDVITRKVENAMVSPLDCDTEGVHFYHTTSRPPNLPYRNFTGGFMNNLNMKSNSKSICTELNYSSPSASPPTGTANDPEINFPSVLPVPMSSIDYEQVVGQETVLSSPLSRMLKKRGSV